MRDHEIRLRGGWTCRPSDGTPGVEHRLTLPTRWGSGETRRLRLTRLFGRPQRVANGQVHLRLDRAPGVRSIHFNGRPIGAISPSSTDYDIPLGILELRNELVLEIETCGESAEWGEIALVFRDESRWMDRPDVLPAN